MAQFAQPVSLDDDEYLRTVALKNARLGLLLWRIANGLLFTFFVFANLLMRSEQPSWPPPGVEQLPVVWPLVITAALLASGVLASRGIAAIRQDDRETMRTQLILAMVLGAAFLIGIAAVSAQIPYSGPYSSIIITMNGVHAFHTIIGMMFMGYVLLRSQKGIYSKNNHWTVEATVVFWHFVGLMWLFFFVVIYLT